MRRFYKVILCPQSSRCSSSEAPDFLLHDFTSWVASERGTGKRPAPCFVAQVKALHLHQQLPSSQVPARHRTRTDASPEKGKPGHQPWGGDHEQQQGWAVGTGEPSESRDNTSSGPALPQFPLQPFPCHGHFGFDLPSVPQAMGSEPGWVPLPKTLPSATLPPPQSFARNFLKTPREGEQKCSSVHPSGPPRGARWAVCSPTWGPCPLQSIYRLAPRAEGYF